MFPWKSPLTPALVLKGLTYQEGNLLCVQIDLEKRELSQKLVLKMGDAMQRGLIAWYFRHMFAVAQGFVQQKHRENGILRSSKFK